MRYITKNNNQIVVEVDTEVIHTQKALQALIKEFDIDDVNIDNESLKNLCNLFLSTYKTQYNYEDLEKLNQECQSIIDNDLNTIKKSF